MSSTILFHLFLLTHLKFSFCHVLTVRPFFVRLPEDVVARVGGEALLHCRAGGSPAPHVTWRRHDGRMPVGRARLVERGHALTITALQTVDDGEYFCQAENEVATVVARATLSVLGRIIINKHTCN